MYYVILLDLTSTKCIISKSSIIRWAIGNYQWYKSVDKWCPDNVVKYVLPVWAPSRDCLTWRCWPRCCSQLHHETANKLRWTSDSARQHRHWTPDTGPEPLLSFIIWIFGMEILGMTSCSGGHCVMSPSLMVLPERHRRHQFRTATGNRKYTDSAGQFWKPQDTVRTAVTANSLSSVTVLASDNRYHQCQPAGLPTPVRGSQQLYWSVMKCVSCCEDQAWLC